jgi:hypothetical protein
MKTENKQNEALNKTDVSGSLSKNQMKHFVRIFIGSMALYADFGLDEVKGIEEETIDKAFSELNIQATKILKGDKSFSTTKEIFEYVQQNYR